MPNVMEYIADNLPHVTPEDVRRFAVTAEIRDDRAFAAELELFVHEQVEALVNERVEALVNEQMVEETLKRKAAALRAKTRWVPTETDIQRGRVLLLETFNQEHNLPVADFARLADKSRQQIYKDIDARRLLALNVGPRGQKLPDWQLEPVKQQLTERVLQATGRLDNWTIYRALSEPVEGLAGRSPVDTVTPASIDDVARVVLNVLGIEVSPPLDAV